MKARWLTVTALLLAGCGTTPATPEAARPDVTYATSAPTPTPSPSTPLVAGPRCLAPGVELSVGEVDAAMGLRAVGITVRNCGTGTYGVNGYPVVDVLDADGKVLDVTVLDGTEHVSRIERYAGPPKPIDVAPGGKVVAVLVWRNITTDAATVAKGAYLSVAPAGGQPRHTLALAVDPGNTGKLAVSPWSSPA
ncbi:DUF4232 domain-containing protein [Dactylosporangium fulvum]|uniref:DUF4232 domain-containing protein n=1 Tax=Dactylosporangium fulvum TaxID=53359 RepID=A0ABY5WAY7_9ACTN|nr:DUF4232 domain-containing protein [Dactylosporangium fulvum]UWP86281.1 DUF4232 domain-containing protein [Dactylosporangium fulvum]